MCVDKFICPTSVKWEAIKRHTRPCEFGFTMATTKFTNDDKDNGDGGSGGDIIYILSSLKSPKLVSSSNFGRVRWCCCSSSVFRRCLFDILSRFSFVSLFSSSICGAQILTFARTHSHTHIRDGFGGGGGGGAGKRNWKMKILIEKINKNGLPQSVVIAAATIHWNECVNFFTMFLLCDRAFVLSFQLASWPGWLAGNGAHSRLAYQWVLGRPDCVCLYVCECCFLWLAPHTYTHKHQTADIWSHPSTSIYNTHANVKSVRN